MKNMSNDVQTYPIAFTKSLPILMRKATLSRLFASRHTSNEVFLSTCLLDLAECVDWENLYFHLGFLVRSFYLHRFKHRSPAVPPRHYLVLRKTHTRAVL